MGAGERITPGKALAHPFITMSHLIDCTSTAASKCVCVSVSLIRSLLLCIGLQIREGAVNDVLMICSVDWLIDWQSCSLALWVGLLAVLWMSTINNNPFTSHPLTQTDQASAGKPTALSLPFCYSTVYCPRSADQQIQTSFHICFSIMWAS